jgi:hypothetical protein
VCNISQQTSFSRWRVVGPWPNPQTGGPLVTSNTQLILIALFTIIILGDGYTQGHSTLCFMSAEVGYSLEHIVLPSEWRTLICYMGNFKETTIFRTLLLCNIVSEDREESPHLHASSFKLLRELCRIGNGFCRLGIYKASSSLQPCLLCRNLNIKITMVKSVHYSPQVDVFSESAFIQLTCKRTRRWRKGKGEL